MEFTSDKGMDIPVVVYVAALADDSVNEPVATVDGVLVLLDCCVTVRVIGMVVTPLGKVTFT